MSEGFGGVFIGSYCYEKIVCEEGSRGGNSSPFIQKGLVNVSKACQRKW